MQWLDDLAIPGPRNHKHVSHGALVSTVAVVHSSSEGKDGTDVSQTLSA